MKLELHIIQSFGPSCLNRDATNSPKDCDFGGYRRARISSQCFKRSIREYFRDNNLVSVGERTKRLRNEVAQYLPALKEQEDELLPHAIDAFVDTYYAKNDSGKPEHASVLLFLSQVELEEVARCIESDWDNLKPIAEARRKKVEEIKAKQTKKKGGDKAEATESSEASEGEAAGGAAEKFKDLPKPKADKATIERLKNAALSSDIALFGRMLAEHSEHRIEAAAQVAHAISTHAVTPELDFFSAVDDLNKDDAGAGMLGVTGFNAAVFYRYALVDMDALIKNLKGDKTVALQTARAFLQAFVEAIPTGKQNSMAAQSLPSLGLFVVREGGAPCSLVNAFCDPISPKKSDKAGGVLGGSVRELTRHWAKYAQVYKERGITEKALFTTEDKENLGALAAADKGSVEDAINAVMKALGEESQEG